MIFSLIPKSLLQLNTIFISILIESLPFVLLGVFAASIIQMFVTEDMVARIVPKNRLLAILFAMFLGVLFPACECGIIPIVRRLVMKGVPLYAGIAFMLTGPIVNPIVLFSTYAAFGNDWSMVAYRAGFALIVALLTGLLISVLFKGDELKGTIRNPSGHHEAFSLREKIWGSLKHAVDEFFSMGKYLIFGAFVAAAVQTYVSTSTLLAIGQGKASSSLVMMGLAYVLSLCSQADAFIASSFRSTFSAGSLVAFLVFGPMLDVKNTIMMLGTFKTRLTLTIIVSVTVIIFIGSLAI